MPRFRCKRRHQRRVLSAAVRGRAGSGVCLVGVRLVCHTDLTFRVDLLGQTARSVLLARYCSYCSVGTASDPTRSSGWRYLRHVTRAGNRRSTFPLFPPLSEEPTQRFPQFPTSVPALPPSVPRPSQGSTPPLPCRYPRVPEPVPRASPLNYVSRVLHGCSMGRIKENKIGP